LRAPIHLALSVPLSRIFFNVQRVAVDIAKLPELARNLARNSNMISRPN